MRIIREASGVIAVWKPAGLATQAPPGIPSAESWLRQQLHGGDPRGYVGVPHRLDRCVSGVVLFAATPRAARKLSRQFERRQIEKTYVAVVDCGPEAAPHVDALERACLGSGPDSVGGDDRHAGAVRWEDLVLKLPDEARTRLAVVGEPQGREAVTFARHLRRLTPGTLLLELAPVTGRMHQLRLQAASRGMPMLGDALYGGPETSWADPQGAEPREKPIALHAARIVYADPDSAAVVTIDAPLPDVWPVTAR
jgi:23S rRNA pseudouridine1911/1915/1917 synthase